MSKELISVNSNDLIKKLQERYEIGKSQIYKRLSYLNIKSHKENGEVFFDSEQLRELDQLNEHLKAGLPMEAYHGSTLVKSETATLDSFETIEAERIQDNNEALNVLIRAAQAKAAGNLIFQNLLAAKFTNNPELLDPDLREQVERSEPVACPKSLNPTQYAQQLLKLHQTASLTTSLSQPSP